MKFTKKSYFRSLQIIDVKFEIKFPNKFTLDDECVVGGIKRQCTTLSLCVLYFTIGDKAVFYKGITGSYFKNPF